VWSVKVKKLVFNFLYISLYSIMLIIANVCFPSDFFNRKLNKNVKQTTVESLIIYLCE